LIGACGRQIRREYVTYHDICFFLISFSEKHILTFVSLHYEAPLMMGGKKLQKIEKHNLE
jgi:hypothetical protein